MRLTVFALLLVACGSEAAVSGTDAGQSTQDDPASRELRPGTRFGASVEEGIDAGSKAVPDASLEDSGDASPDADPGAYCECATALQRCHQGTVCAVPVHLCTTAYRVVDDQKVYRSADWGSSPLSGCTQENGAWCCDN